MNNPDFILARESEFARSLVDEELDYFKRSYGDAQACSRARLVAWSGRAPWVALRIASALGSTLCRDGGAA